jgi:steroid 5-alpha reductase family enzyme
MLNEFICLLAVAIGFAVGMMLVVWFAALRWKNLGIVDIAWSLGFLPVAVLFALAAHGDPMRRGLIAAMAGIWSLRLASHISVRVFKHHPQEDVRYAKLRADWGTRLKSKTLLFFQFQAAILAALSTVFLVPCLNPRAGITPLEWTGAAIWLVALAGESLADSQLNNFKSIAENKGRICQVGLWNYSRHPNYFFEWLVWVGFFVFAWDSPGGCYTVLCPGLMLFFLLRVTGIPLTEELSVQSKGDAYREYQRTTSAFVPWFKKSSLPPTEKIYEH